MMIEKKIVQFKQLHKRNCDVILKSIIYHSQMYQYDVDGGAFSVALSCHLINSGIWLKSKIMRVS
jgi:hypothetical protein